jgi:ribosomal-protein-alanine N-acetyltransferase
VKQIRVRPMTAADLDTALAIERETPQAPHWKPADYEISFHQNRNSPLRHAAFVAEEEEVLGFVVGRLLLDGEQNICELESIVVREAARRRGAGGLLLKTLAAWAEKLGALRLELEVRESNAASLSLYERLGLRREGVRRRYYTAPDEDAVLMGRELGSSGTAASGLPRQTPVTGGGKSSRKSD